MPQMAPINWTLLYTTFIFLFLFSLILNYFLYSYMPQNKVLSKYFKMTNWKW